MIKQPFAQFLNRLTITGFDGPFGAVHDLGDLLVGQFFIVVHHENGSLLRRQSGDGLIDLLA